MNTFRVLVMDDSKDLIQTFNGRAPHQEIVAGVTWRIEYDLVHIEVKKTGGGNEFTDATLLAILKSFQNPPDLIFSDYGFVAEDDGDLQPNEYFKVARNPADLKRALLAYVGNSNSPDSGKHMVAVQTLLSNTAPFYLYTYTGKDYREIHPKPFERANQVHGALNRDVRLVDISNELFDDDRLSGDDKPLRAYLTAGLLARIVDRELLIHVLAYENQRLRFIRYKRSSFAIATIVLIGGTIGALSEWLGGLVTESFGQNPALGVILLLLGVLLIVASGLGLPWLFERVLADLFPQEDQLVGTNNVERSKN